MTENDKILSDLAIKREECSHCGAIWINGTHVWATGCTGTKTELDLASLVCNTPYGDKSKCINPMVGKEGGDSWKKRLDVLQDFDEELKRQNSE